LTLHLASNLAWNLGRLDDARAVYLQLIQSAGSDLAAARNAMIGLGDVEMLAGNLPAAKEHYAAAEHLSDRKSQNQSVELAKLGSYPWTVEDYLDRGDYDQALDALNEWENQYPLQKLEGTSLLLRGKVWFVRQPCQTALQFLRLAETVNPAGAQVPEALWLRANCLMSLGKYQQAIELFARVQTEFTRGEFAAQAREKLAECRQRLKSSASSSQ
jgi:tetratricopeptide (TPR) repeat protein